MKTTLSSKKAIALPVEHVTGGICTSWYVVHFDEEVSLGRRNQIILAGLKGWEIKNIWSSAGTTYSFSPTLWDNTPAYAGKLTYRIKNISGTSIFKHCWLSLYQPWFMVCISTGYSGVWLWPWQWFCRAISDRRSWLATDFSISKHTELKCSSVSWGRVTSRGDRNFWCILSCCCT